MENADLLLALQGGLQAPPNNERDEQGGGGAPPNNEHGERVDASNAAQMGVNQEPA